ncbi:hypothetical protein PLEOSDRAFT_160664 [Pleurotus ostreatus PC15]|uniref:Uncharacterized protein n=1 Tax=Pleurotus ostreatus (strain PC15) TaxID=1137138 RepID=A0A067NPN6_PLEO1|nr:hypothetical protein PLEOSDRAFT_160664 [Pleurotus ostreatus PC15]
MIALASPGLLVYVQPMNEGMFSAAWKNGGNPFSLSVEDGDQHLMLLAVSWADHKDGAFTKAKAREYLENAGY